MTADRSRRAAAAAALLSPAAALLAAAAIAPAPAAAQDAHADGLLTECLACHGDDAAGPGMPSLGGQPELYVLYQLVFLRDGQRENEVMSLVLEGRDDAELRELSAAVATLPPPPPAPGPLDPALAEVGAELAEGHRCGACHISDYSGAKHVPRLAGQDEEYLLSSLRAYRSGERIGIRAAMSEVVSGMTDDDLAALAHHLAHLPR